MNGNNYLLDTNIVTAILNQEIGVEENLKGNRTFMSVTVLGELYFGAKNSARRTANLQKIETFIAVCTIVDCDTITADYYSEIRLALKLEGKPIPENDLWIAAVARQHNLTLVTRDAHFSEIDHLSVVRW
jgi:tRNA(fMet)-specific endonuclease VapC